MQFNMLKKTITFHMVIVFFIFDRLLKYIALKYFVSAQAGILNDILVFRYVKNFYIAFSLPFISGIWLILVILAILAFLISLMRETKESSIDKLSLMLIIAGAASNLIDRLYYGYVADYIDLKYFTVFNVADCMIVAGAAMTIFSVYFRSKTKAQISK
jgi:signal peptidase II